MKESYRSRCWSRRWLLVLAASLQGANAANRQSRKLAIGDFQELNELLQGATIRLPDALGVTGGNRDRIRLDLRNVLCTEISVDDVVLSSQKTEDVSSRLQLDVQGLAMSCTMDYYYKFWFRRSGSASVVSTGNRASIAAVVSPDQHTSAIDLCNPEVSIDDANFRGDISAVVLNTVERMLRDRVEAMAQDRICEELSKFMTTHVAELLRRMEDTLAMYPADMAFDPVQSEDELGVIPDNVRLLDFLDKETGIVGWVGRILDEVVAHVSQQVDDTEGPKSTGSDMNLNVLLRKNLLEDRAFILDITDDLQLYQSLDTLMETTVLLDSVKVFGLDTLTTFEPLVPTGKHTLQNGLSWEYLNVELDVTISMKPSTLEDSIIVDPPGSGSGAEERVKLKFAFQNVNAIASFLLAVDKDQLGALPLGSLLERSNLVRCALSTLYRSELSGLSVEVSDIQSPILEGFVSVGMDRIVSSSVEAFLLIYEAKLLEAAPSFFQIAVREFVNKLLTHRADDDEVTCSLFGNFSSSTSDFVDFRELLLPPDLSRAAGGAGLEPYGDLVSSTVSTFRDQVLAIDEDGKPKINSLIRDLQVQSANSTDEGIYFGDVLNKNFSIGLENFQATIEARISEMRIENLDSFDYPLKLLEPVKGEAHTLNNSASVGMGGRPVRLVTKALIGLTDEAGLNLRNEVVVKLELSTASMLLPIVWQIREKQLFSVRLRDTLNLNCWITNVLLPSLEGNGIQLPQHAFSLERFNLIISCWSCSSPLFDEMVKFLYSPFDGGNATGEVLNYALLLFESDYVQVPMKRFFGEASDKCLEKPDGMVSNVKIDIQSVGDNGRWGFEKAGRDTKAVYFTVANVVVVVCLLLLFIATKWIIRKRNQKWRGSLSPASLSTLREIETEENRKEIELNHETTQSMFRSRHLPRHVRLLVPAVLLLNIGLFLGGHLALLSTVDIEGQVAGETFFVREFLSFSFISATARAYRNGGSEMAVLVWIFTGVWPYLKLVTSLVLWFCPPQKISASRRGSILLWLDVFAKLSVVDIFMTLIAVSAVLVYVGGPDDELTTEGEYFSMKLIVVPGGGFYCIIMAQQISRVSSRYLLDCHRHVVAMGSFEYEQRRSMLRSIAPQSMEPAYEANEVEGSANYKEREQYVGSFCAEGATHVVPDSECGEKLPVSNSDETTGDGLVGSPYTPASGRVVNRSTLAVILVGFSLVLLSIIGCFLAPSVSLNTKTVWGMLESGLAFDEAVKEYSVLRILSLILLQLRFVLRSTVDYIGLGFLLGLVIISSATFPLMNALSSVRQWFRDRKQRETTEGSVDGNGNKKKTLVALLAVFPFEICQSCFRRFVKRYKRRARTKGYDRTDMALLPAFRLKAWQHMEVYCIAFAIACWQLGAVTAYAIHAYCFILERLYELLVYLGLRQQTSAECFRLQASSLSTVLILLVAFGVLLTSFLIQAISQYRKIMASARKLLKDYDATRTEKDQPWLEECQSGETEATQMDSFCLGVDDEDCKS